MTDRDRLLQLVNARHACIRIVTDEEDYVVGILCDIAMSLDGKLPAWSASMGVHDALFMESEGVKDTEKPAPALYYLCNNDLGRLVVLFDIAAQLDNALTLRCLRDLITRFRKSGRTLILLDHDDRLPSVIAASATLFEVSLPDADELEALIRSTLLRLRKKRSIKVDIKMEELRTIIRNLSGLTRSQAEQIIADCVSEDHRFHAGDLNTVLARKRQMLYQDGLLEYVKAPVSLDEIAGMSRLKEWLAQRTKTFTKKAQEFGLEAPRGLLMLGVPGAGKSLCAKAIATAWQRPLLRLDPSVLYDRYVGESERRLRQALRQAEAMAPIVLWIDEIEKGFASAASQSIDGGLSRRMFGTLLTWMQEHTAPVFLIATANDVEALPPEMLRKGRFDETFFVDLPNKDVRKDIIAIHLRKRGRDPEDFDLMHLASVCDGFTGAEIEQAIVSALHSAFAEGKDIDGKRLEKAMRTSPPLSVTQEEKVTALRYWALERCVPAD